MPSFTSFKKVNFSILLAVLLSGLLLIWLLSGTIYTAESNPPDLTPEESRIQLPQVETQLLIAQRYKPTIQLQGQLEPLKQTAIVSRLNGVIDRIAINLGERIEQDTLLIRLDLESRPSALQRAEAELNLALANQRATEQLRQQNLGSETDLLRQKAATASALAERDRLQQELKHTEIHAPFTGHVEALPIELGSIVQVGDVLLQLIDVQQLKLTGQIPQQQVNHLSVGLPVTARLLDGRELEGEISFIASLADPQTRSFRVEAIIDNPALLRIAGASASLSIALPPTQAHRFSPAHLTLDDQGRTGVRVIDSESRIGFHQVEILSLDTAGVWVSGLPDQIELVIQGAGFVELGQTVETFQVESN